MIDLASFLAVQLKNSQKMHGLQRSPLAPTMDLRAGLNQVQSSPHDLLSWVDVIMAAVEGGLRSGSSPFALAQALVNRQTADTAKPQQPALAQFAEEAKVDRQKPEERPGGNDNVSARDQAVLAEQDNPDAGDELILAAAARILAKRKQDQA